MEVAGTLLGLAAIDLVGVRQGLAVVREQGQIDGQGLAAAAQRLGQVALQAAIEAALQFVDLGERGEQGGAHGRIRGRLREGATGGGHRGKAGGGIEQERQQGEGRTFGAVILEAEVLLAQRGGMLVNGPGSDGILRSAHGSLR